MAKDKTKTEAAPAATEENPKKSNRSKVNDRCVRVESSLRRIARFVNSEEFSEPDVSAIFKWLGEQMKAQEQVALNRVRNVRAPAVTVAPPLKA